MTEQSTRFIIKGDDFSATERVTTAFQWFEDTPEGRRILEQAYDLHGERLNVYVCERDEMGSDFGAVYDGEHHFLTVCPEQVDEIVYVSADGVQFTPDIRAVIAHECVHATQEGGYQASVAITRYREKVRDEVFAETRDAFVAKCRPMLVEIEDSDALRAALEMAYDEIFAPVIDDLAAQVEARVQSSFEMQKYAMTYLIYLPAARQRKYIKNIMF